MIGKKVYLLSLGCAKNLVDSECMSSMLKTAGYVLQAEPADADVLVVNTCGFIAAAKQEAIDHILRLADYKKPAGRADFLIVTGCLAQRYAREIRQQMPEADAVLGTADYDKIVQTIESLYADAGEDLPLPCQAGSLEHLKAARQPSTPSTYAYLKVAEGCSNCCSYCAIPAIRGAFHSRPMPEILEEARRLSEMGYGEIILIAQDTTRYGLDLYGHRCLSDLLNALCEIDTVRLLRVLYVYADGLTDDLIETLSGQPKIAHYLDLPIQHASDRILKAMNRRDTHDSLTAVISRLRQAMPDLVLRSTVLVGFPGEKAEDFDMLLAFLKEIRFERLGCFVFSAEENTPAFDMKPRVRADVAQRRHDQVMALQQEISLAANQARIGAHVMVTLESIASDGIFYIGRSFGEAPEVDPIILVAAGRDGLALGQTCPVKLLDAGEYDLTGVTF